MNNQKLIERFKKMSRDRSQGHLTVIFQEAAEALEQTNSELTTLREDRSKTIKLRNEHINRINMLMKKLSDVQKYHNSLEKISTQRLERQIKAQVELKQAKKERVGKVLIREDLLDKLVWEEIGKEAKGGVPIDKVLVNSEVLEKLIKYFIQQKSMYDCRFRNQKNADELELQVRKELGLDE